MLHAVMHVDEIMGLFQVRAVITEFQAGVDPTIWESVPETLELPEEDASGDALSTFIAAIRLWSERTNSK